MKRITKYILIIIVLRTGITAFAQSKNAKLDLNIRVYENGKPLSNVSVIQSVLNFKDTLVIDFPSDKANNLQLEANKVFKLTFECKGYTSKTLEISTIGMNENASKNYFYPVGINLFKEPKGIDVSALKNPIGRVIFNKEKNEFIDDAAYAKSVAPQLGKLQKELEKK